MDYTVYFDESENPPDKSGKPRVYSIAGCVGTDRQWVKFKKKWKAALDRDVLPRWLEVYGEGKPAYFHMTDFANLHSKIYGDWSEDKKKGFLQELHTIMAKHTMRRFATCIPMADYEELTDEEKLVFRHPHVCAIINCMKRIMAWADRINLREPFLYVFEKGSTHDKGVRELFSELLTDEARDAYRVGSLEFKDKRLSPPLQAADIIAVETRWELCRRLDPNNTRAPRLSAKNLEVRTLDEWCFMDRTHFRDILDRPDAKEALSVEGIKEAAAYAKKKKLI